MTEAAVTEAATPEAAALFTQAVAEIVGLHMFFADWFSGRMDTDFARCENALADDFTQISPDGVLHERAGVIDRLKRAHGRIRGEFSIEIAEMRVFWRSDTALLAGYIEDQHDNGQLRRRRSTALLVRQTSAPFGVAWRHLHETWL